MCEVDAECAAAAEAAAKTLESLGHTVEVASPAALDESELVGTFLNVVAANALGLVEELGAMAGRPVTADDVEPGTWALAEAGRAVTAVQYQQTIAAAHAWTRRVLAWWHDPDDAYDVLLTPTLAALPAGARHAEPGRRRPRDGHDPADAVRRVRRRVQRHRPARDVGAGRDERRRPADRRPARGRGVPRGRAAGARRPARARGAVGGPPPADLRGYHEGRQPWATNSPGSTRRRRPSWSGSGRCRPLELVDAAIARIERLEPAVNAFTTTRFERARDRGRGRAARRAVPRRAVRVKDLSCTLAGEPSYDGVPVLAKKDYRAPVTSHLAARFQAAGLVIVGRTNTPELGIMPTTEPLAFGPTPQPVGPDAHAGRVVAAGRRPRSRAGMVPFAHASDGGGSIRIPAACCGLVGLKTSRGRTSVGPGERRARPAAVGAVRGDPLGARRGRAARRGRRTRGRRPGRAAARRRRATRRRSNIEPAPLRIGLMTTMPGTSRPGRPRVRRRGRDRPRGCSTAAGHHVEVAHPAAFDETERMTAFIPIWSAMAAAEPDRDRPPDRARRDARRRRAAHLVPRRARPRGRPAASCSTRSSAMGAFARRFTQWWADGWDLLLTPTLGELPPELGVLQTPDDPVVGFGRGGTFTPFTPVANQTGQPAISLPGRARARAGCPSARTSSPLPAARTCCSRSPGCSSASLDWSAPPRRRSMADARSALGGGQGFYGDTPRAVAGLLEDGVDYLCLEALAELTLAILQKDRARDESLGYTRDLPRYLGAALPAVLDGRTKVITNAGGINPRAAAHAAIETAQALGVSGLKIATVHRRRPHAAARRRARRDRRPGSRTSRPARRSTTMGADALFFAAYLGAFPIADALAQGADIVITGRVADAALFLAPLIHEHGWARDDWDRLAAGVLVGHLLECSGQVAGGNFSGDWWTIPEPWNLPYPIAEVAADGTAVITKPAASGGRVDVDTVRHQLLYEVHDPAAYLSPDVVADFTSRDVHRSRRRPRAGHRRARQARDRHATRRCSRTRRAGRARPASRSRGPTRRRRRRRSPRSSCERVEMAGHRGRRVGGGALGRERARRRHRARRPTPSRPSACARIAWRCADQRDARRRSGASSCRSRSSAPPAGMTGIGPRRRRADRAARHLADAGGQDARRPARDRRRGGGLMHVATSRACSGRCRSARRA